jgi:hypothetical protein
LDREGKLIVHTITRDSGHFNVTVSTAGSYAVEVQSVGYRTGQVGSVELEAGHTTTVEIRLSKSAIPLDPLTVTVAARVPALERVGYYRRAAEGFGAFLDRAAIERRRAYATSQLFQGIPGVILRPIMGGKWKVLLRAGVGATFGQAYCDPKVFVDGLVVPAFNFDDDIRPMDIEAIEVYRGSAQLPPQFGGAESACGVILVWRRQAGS